MIAVPVIEDHEITVKAVIVDEVEIKAAYRKTVQRQKTEMVTGMIPAAIEMINGQPTLIPEHEGERPQKAVIMMGLVDLDGQPVMEWN